MKKIRVNSFKLLSPLARTQTEALQHAKFRALLIKPLKSIQDIIHRRIVSIYKNFPMSR